MNEKFGYTVLALLNVLTIGGSLYAIVVLKAYSSFISLGIGIMFLYLSIRELRKL